jgi:excisionase family DNA binding protein
MIGTTEVGRLLGVSGQRVRQLISTGRLRATKMGRDWFVLPADLEPVRERKPGRPKNLSPLT